MTDPNETNKPAETDPRQPLKEAYTQDAGLPDDLAETRASAETRRMQGGTDETFDARGDVHDKPGGFQTDQNEPETS